MNQQTHYDFMQTKMRFALHQFQFDVLILNSYLKDFTITVMYKIRIYFDGLAQKLKWDGDWETLC